jgi:hypothetical protein
MAHRDSLPPFCALLLLDAFRDFGRLRCEKVVERVTKWKIKAEGSFVLPTFLSINSF